MKWKPGDIAVEGGKPRPENPRRTHCRNGHKYTDETTRWYYQGKKYGRNDYWNVHCTECVRGASARWYQSLTVEKREEYLRRMRQKKNPEYGGVRISNRQGFPEAVFFRCGHARTPTNMCPSGGSGRGYSCRVCKRERNIQEKRAKAEQHRRVRELSLLQSLLEKYPEAVSGTG